MAVGKTSDWLMADFTTTNGTDFMAVTLPPWLQIDPIAPARIKLQANQQRNAAAASERSAQAQAQDLIFRRERAQAQDAAQERSEARREKVFQQTQDRELADAALQLQMRREAQLEKTRQFEATLRLKQQEAEQEAKSAALQMQGMNAVQKGLEAGQPLQKLISDNAPLLFAKNPERMASAIPKGVTAPDFVAREIRDESGNPMGIRAIPGAHGSIKPLPRTTMSPDGMLQADKLRLNVISRQLEEDPTNPQLLQSRDAIMQRLEAITSGRGQAAPVANGALPVAPAAAAAPRSDTIRVKSPDGKTGMVPRAQWEASSEEERKGWEEIEPAAAEIPVDEEEPAPEEE